MLSARDIARSFQTTKHTKIAKTVVMTHALR
jgi:hypothetical protein